MGAEYTLDSGGGVLLTTGLTWTRPSNPLSCTVNLPIATRNSSGDMGVGNYSLRWRPLPPRFAKIIAE